MKSALRTTLAQFHGRRAQTSQSGGNGEILRVSGQLRVPSDHAPTNSADAIEAVRRGHPLLRGLLVTGAGLSTGGEQTSWRQDSGLAEAAFVYCIKGGGWWKSCGRLSLIRKGDLLVLPSALTGCYGPQACRPWTTYWVRATGEHLPVYLRELLLEPTTPILRVGNSPRIMRLFAEVQAALGQGASYWNLLQASTAMSYLICCLIRSRQDATPESCDTAQSVAQAIIYMSEHIREPLRVSTMARIAGLSTPHFGEVFKRHTGCSPREYLHLLRIHEACHLLADSNLSIKEVAGQAGYGDPLHFSRQFKAFEGVSPSEYRLRRAVGQR